MTVMEDRGVSLFVKDGFDVVRLTDLENIFQPSIICKITPKGGKEALIFGVVYRSPSCELNEKVREQLYKLYGTNRKEQVIIVGDYNHPEINWREDRCHTSESHNAWKFLDVMHDNYIFQNVQLPTHQRGQQQPNILDLILSDREGRVNNLEHLPPLGKSHHSMLVFELDGGLIDIKAKKSMKPLYDKGDYSNMRTFVNDIDWKDKLRENDSVDECWNNIHTVIKEAIDKFIPRKCLSNSKKWRAPVPRTVLDKIRLKRRLKKMYDKYPTKENWNNYARARNQVTWVTRREEKNTEKRIAKNIKTNPKGLQIHHYLSSKSKPRESVANLTKPDGSLTENDSEKAHVLNTFFCSVFSSEDDNDIPTFESGCDVTVSECDGNPRTNDKSSQGP